MINAKIFDRKVKLRSFKEMLTSEYFLLEGKMDVPGYIALQTSKKVEDIMAVVIDRHLIGRMANIDVNSFECESIKYKGKTYTNFETYPYGVSHLGDIFIRDERPNLPLWIFSAALNFKINRSFDISQINTVYDDLLNKPAVDVIPTLNPFIKHFFKKKLSIIQRLKLFTKVSLIILKAPIQLLFNFIAVKTKRRK